MICCKRVEIYDKVNHLMCQYMVFGMESAQVSTLSPALDIVHTLWLPRCGASEALTVWAPAWIVAGQEALAGSLSRTPFLRAVEIRNELDDRNVKATGRKGLRAIWSFQ